MDGLWSVEVSIGAKGKTSADGEDNDIRVQR